MERKLLIYGWRDSELLKLIQTEFDNLLKSMDKVPQPFEFFQIQFTFVSKLVQITGVSLETALLENTAYYVRIGCHDWKHDKNNPVWREYWQKITKGENPVEDAFLMYLSECKKYKDQPVTECFSYSYYEPEKAVYLHFQNNFASDASPLAPENLLLRRRELLKMFKEIKEKYPEAQEVKGSSWLYAYESYKSLFPPEFIAQLRPTEPGLKGNGIWGQFLARDGGINQNRITQFLQNINQASTKEQLMQSFPIPTYDTNASVDCFYNFLGL